MNRVILRVIRQKHDPYLDPKDFYHPSKNEDSRLLEPEFRALFLWVISGHIRVMVFYKEFKTF
jgi:hypothetical protein